MCLEGPVGLERLGVGMEAQLLRSLSIRHSQQWARDDKALN